MTVETEYEHDHEPQLDEEPAIDPVCGMEVERMPALSVTYEGEPVFFCSETCRERFLRDPARYSVSSSLIETK